MNPFRLSGRILYVAGLSLFQVWREVFINLGRRVRGLPPLPRPAERVYRPEVEAEKVATIETGAVAELRTRHGVKIVPAVFNSRKLSDLAPGCYGFTTPWSVRSDSITLGTRGGTVELEIHKAMDGVRYLVGYIESGTAEVLKKFPRATIMVSTNPWCGFRLAVAIPLVQILPGLDDRSVPDNSTTILDLRVDRVD